MTTPNIPPLKSMQEKATRLGHAFQWAEDYLKQDGTPGKRFKSAKTLQHFIDDYYCHLDERHCYEIVPDTFYMYFDLDVKLDNPDEELTDEILFYWFDSFYREFIAYLISHCPNELEKITNIDYHVPGQEPILVRNSFNFLLPDWVVTTASDASKLSLHLVNRNVIYQDLTFFKQFYNSFNSYWTSFVPKEHPFKKAFDISVASKNRQMRLCGSTKWGSNRVLRVLSAAHPMGIKPSRTFISDAVNDPNIHAKLFSPQVAKTLFTDQNKTTESKVTHFNYPEANNPEHHDQLRQLLAMLKEERADNYEWWKNIAFIFKQHHLPYHLFEEFSKRSNKFDKIECRKGWDNITLKSVDKPLTLGTLHFYAREDNPVKYNTFKAAYQHVTIDLPFTANLTIKERFIPSELYINQFKCHNIIALQSNMMTGKTHSLPVVFAEIQGVIVVVYFRISLSKELKEKWKKDNFSFYQDIQGPIDLSKHPRIIIQIDSLPRLIGKCDLLILDEIESTYTHLCSSIYIKHQECFNALRTYIKHTPKVLLADANLSDQTVDILTEKRISQTIKIQNKWESFSDLKAKFLNDKTLLIQLIVDLVGKGKRICIPTNSLRFSKQIVELLQTKFPQKKVLLINSQTTKDFSDRCVASWIHYDVLVYTPSIVAGVSFDVKDHFHVCCAMFISRSSNAEMSSQMLFRVRHLADNQMYICTPYDSKGSPNLPITIEEIEAHLNRTVDAGHQHLQQAGLSIEHFTRGVKKNQYYRLYAAFLRKRNLSNLYFESYLYMILKNHGVEITKYNLPNPNQKEIDPLTNLSDKEKDQVVADFRKTMASIEEKEVTELVQVPPIDPGLYITLRDSKKEKTREQQLQMTKYQLLSAFSVRWDTTLDDCREWLCNNKNYIYAYNYIKQFIGENVIKAIELAKKKHGEKYNQHFSYEVATYKSKEYSSDSEESSDDSPIHSDYKTSLLQKKDIRASVIPSIHYDRKWLKVTLCFEFLRYIGFHTIREYRKDMIPDERGEVIRPNWGALHNYCRTNEEYIRAIFDCKMIKWKEELDGKETNTLSIFVNQKLETTIGIKIVATSTKCTLYHIKYLFQPLLPSALKEKQQEEQEYWQMIETIEDPTEMIEEDPEEDIEALREFTLLNRRERKKMRSRVVDDEEEDSDVQIKKKRLLKV